MPDVSVVMSTYNGLRDLPQSVASILAQDGVDFEFVIVDDGSTDGTGAWLDALARREPRVRVIHKPNEGLTRALVRGCRAARGAFIARQDADDVSLPGRLATLAAMLHADASLAFVSSWAEVVGPEGELLLTHTRPADPDEATALMMVGRQGPPGHGSVMFRKTAYEQVGGYRPEFYYAQDADLWLRLGTVGRVAYAQQVFYRFRIDEDSISGGKFRHKLPFARMVDECYAARQAGESEAPILARAPTPEKTGRNMVRGSRAAALYFIGRCLLARRDARARAYLVRCLRVQPLHLRAWAALALALARGLRSEVGGRKSEVGSPRSEVGSPTAGQTAKHAK